MSVGDSFTELARSVASLYKEIATTSVRFDMHAGYNRETLARFERELSTLAARIAEIHDQHVRERAELHARIEVLSGRLTALSEQALHAVAREAARDVVRNQLS